MKTIAGHIRQVYRQLRVSNSLIFCMLSTKRELLRFIMVSICANHIALVYFFPFRSFLRMCVIHVRLSNCNVLSDIWNDSIRTVATPSNKFLFGRFFFSPFASFTLLLFNFIYVCRLNWISVYVFVRTIEWTIITAHRAVDGIEKLN